MNGKSPQFVLNKLFWKGKNFRSNNKFEESELAFKEYANLLPKHLSHIPFLWIAEMNAEEQKYEQSFNHLQNYFEGCTYPYASKIAKEFAQSFEHNGDVFYSVELRRLSKEFDALQKKMRSDGE